MLKLKYRIAMPVMFVTLLCVTCDPVTYLYGPQAMYGDRRYPMAYRNFAQMDAHGVSSMQQPAAIYHTAAPHSHYHIEEPRRVNSSFTFSDFLNAVNELDSHHEEVRAADEFPPFFPGLRVSDSTKHGYKLQTEHTGDATPTIPIIPPASPAEKTGISVSFLKPDWSSITKPAATTNLDKWSGLLQLFLAFITGSKSGGLEFNGFKDLIINGLVKPILATKGNIKSFISKITIPLLSLLLINVEILVTVWWLWGDCPKETKMESMNATSANNYTNA